MFQNRWSRQCQCTRDDRLHLQPRAFYLHLRGGGGASWSTHVHSIPVDNNTYICWQADIYKRSVKTTAGWGGARGMQVDDD